MDSTALGVRQDADGNGTTDVAMRHILAAQWANTGVIDGLAVTGGTTMAYKVSAGTAVCSKGPSDGRVLAWWPGGTTDVVAANPASNPRTDVVYVYSNDMTQGDPDNLVHVGVAVGTASVTAPAPSIPTYATPLAYMRVPSGATNTQQTTLAQPVGNAIPYGGSLGLLLDKVYTGGYQIIQAGAPRVIVAGTVTVQTRRLVDVGMSVTWCPSGLSAGATGSGYVDWTLDGVVIRTFRKMFPWFQGDNAFTCDYFEDTAYEVAKGSHTVQLRLWGSTSAPAGNVGYTGAGGAGWPGVRLTVKDGGVAD